MMNFQKCLIVFSICFCAILTVFTGCSQSGAERCAVEGKVIFDGKPLADAQVTIRTEAGPGAGAVTNSSGEFVIVQSSGPMPGNVQIMVEKLESHEVKGSDGRTTTEYKPALPEKVQGKSHPYTLKKGANKIELNLDQ
jgi:hypothetical protein